MLRVPSGNSVSKETLSDALSAVKIYVYIGGSFSSYYWVQTTTTLYELRTNISLTSYQYFFSAGGCIVYNSYESYTKVSDVL